jgi:homoserine kinase
MAPLNIDYSTIVKIHAPATVANMVCGFDVLGFAVNDPYDEMQIRFSATPGITIINDDEYNLPTDPEKNVAGAALLAMMEEINEPVGFELTIKKISNQVAVWVQAPQVQQVLWWQPIN